MAKFKWSRYLFLIAVVSFFIFYLQIPVPAANGELQVTMLNLIILIVYSLFLLLSFKLIASIWKKEVELKQKEAERYYFEMYSTELEKTNKRMRTLQHDYANILLSLNGYIQNQDMKGLAAYFNKFVLKTGHHEPGVFPSLENMYISEIKGLLAAKLLKAGDLSVSAQVEIPEKIDYISIDKIDLSRILGILLDNAIEASAVQEFSQIQVAFLNTHNNGVLIVINNTLKQPFPDMSRLFEESYSTKENSRGSGLYNVKQILSKYPAITLNTYLENEWFIQELLIERKESK
ncbi:sensor histidine kinase [Lysinibacillus sp. 3P01SB]|uniref:sensor histidine kinase n=1 Tax=Lysinibacillus sp. 3P01SB TaxID=3132284 RepID=UPI0039A49D71